MRIFLLTACLACIATADELAGARNQVKRFISSQLSDSIINKGVQSLYKSALAGDSYDTACTNLKTAVKSEFFSQTKLISALMTLREHLSDTDAFLDVAKHSLRKKAAPFYNKVKKIKPKTLKAYNKIFVKMINKRMVKAVATLVKRSSSAKDWKYFVDDLYNVAEFKTLGIARVN
ncbi:unnamed protein product [Bursaphelenchus xylophilus]|uniref:(pine wood nematode) hypothetical protein n=1 Tax=Bursaphelenchus xylophilus TaxID=6326 RepID=A0A1I7SB67_BURXY|nr:unnamed protein product [Bursaphelenchus xylophilus]CAG9118712.1 unnamed protein product [Bursaphelenchus xylophilus]